MLLFVEGPREVLQPFVRKSYFAGDYVTSYDVSTVVLANEPTPVCKRAMYGDNRTWGHCSIGY